MTKRVNLGLKEALKEKEERKRKRQELEDKGWVTQKIGEKTIVIEPTPSELDTTCMSIQNGLLHQTPISQEEVEKERLMKELQEAKDKLATIEEEKGE